ncbi:MAG: transposase, partial [Hyphomicrobium sp.]|nr:transposase [Hyphomicrobium sp.]
TEEKLKQQGLNSRIHRRGVRGRPLSERQQNANRKKSKVRARVEHIFGAQETAPGGRIVRSIGFERAAAKIGLQNLVYNMRRMVSLERMAAT